MSRLSSFNSGAFRFALLIAGLFALGSLVLLAVVDRSIEAYAQEATVVSLKAETATLMQDWPEGGLAELRDAIAPREQLAIEQPFQYLLLDAHGRRLAGRLPMAAAHSGWGAVAFADDRERETAARPEILRTLGTRLADGALLVVATDTFDVQKLRHRLAAFTIASSIALTLLALIGGYAIGLVFLQRLARVNGAVARIMTGDLAERLPTIGMSPEFDHLSRNLNAMLDRISALMDGLRQLSTDIAHDLRTPLTRLQQRLEAMRASASPEEYEAGIEAALAQIEEIHAIFRALLRIGLIEGGEQARKLETVDLSELVARVAEAYRPTAEDAGRRFSLAIAEGLHAAGDAELLAQLLTNLVDNALQHTPQGVAIAMALRREGARVVIAVSDEGGGIPPDQRGKVLTRFYRLDASRHSPGAGLGLALVAAIAALHRAELVLADNRPGLRVELHFPQAE
ncbi:MAG: HAMP domain-containing protein [Sphingomonadales bacterium]|nr:HAMP domain-containing protein [Sphingomonadales bacterium]